MLRVTLIFLISTCALPCPLSHGHARYMHALSSPASLKGDRESRGPSVAAFALRREAVLGYVAAALDLLGADGAVEDVVLETKFFD